MPFYTQKYPPPRAPHIPRDKGRCDPVRAKLVDGLRQELLSPAHDDHTCAMKPYIAINGGAIELDERDD